MRWNHKRVKAIKAASAPSKPKSPWNSLEVARIIVGAMTPLLIAIGGGYLTWVSHVQDIEKEKVERLRKTKIDLEPMVIELAHLMSAEVKLYQSLYDEFLGGYGQKSLSKQDVDESLSRYQSQLDALTSKEGDDWSKIRATIPDEHAYERIRAAFITKVYWKQRLDLNHCMQEARNEVAIGHEAKPVLEACYFYNHTKQLEECSAWFYERLINYEKPDDFMLHSPSTCPGEPDPPNAGMKLIPIKPTASFSSK